VDLASVGGIVASLCSLLLATITIYMFSRKLKKYDGLVDSVSDLLRYETDEEGNILLDARLSGMMTALSSNMAKSLKMSLLQGLSVNAKLESGLKGAITKDIVEKKMPLLGLVGDVLGINTQKWISKHPDALVQLAPLLGKLNLGALGQSPNNSGGSAGYG